MSDQRSVRIGLHARNDYAFAEGDYLVIREARIETIKMLSFTQTSVFERLRNQNPDLEFIVRLHDPRVGMAYPGPDDFAQAASARMEELRPFAVKFEILNEPNHNEGYEGWGSSDADARSFCDWYLEVLSLLRLACPWAQFGFPGPGAELASPRHGMAGDLQRRGPCVGLARMPRLLATRQPSEE